ncbi:MAG: alginate export family protein [Acidobacteria bacterium]|nr:alginate export family protein [Acidobacteriota bacterium]
MRLRGAVVLLLLNLMAWGEEWKFSFEQRTRYEGRWGINFGKDPEEQYALLRTRLGLAYTPVSWLKISAMAQDARAPGYATASASYRDPLDLQEAYVEINGAKKTGFAMLVGRQMVNYGEARLIGSPQWGNVARTWDQARASYKWTKWTAEGLLVSPVKVQTDGFNRIRLGDRIWGAYVTGREVWPKTQTDFYVLRHDKDQWRVNAYGFRWGGPLPRGFQFDMEGVLENGQVAAARQRAGAYYGGLSRGLTVGGRKVTVSGEYKYASGTENPADLSRYGTFDQFYPANHDKFGHEDLVGWRNIHNVRAVAVSPVAKRVSVTVMYDSYWLASERDALYNGSGNAVARSPLGTAGRHVGQEVDVFSTFQAGKRWSFGAGYGYFVVGEFVRKTTPGVSPQLVYFFYTFSL